MFYRIAFTLFFCVDFSTVLNNRLIRPHPTFEKTYLLLPGLHVLLRLLLDHLVGYFYSLVFGGLTISDGVRHGACLDFSS